jgi:hypothetical protein
MEEAMKQVSENALIKRINRRIGRYDAKTYTVWGETLRKARLYPGGYEDMNLGRYYTIDNHSNGLTGAHIDLEQYGREVGALATWEALRS